MSGGGAGADPRGVVDADARLLASVRKLTAATARGAKSFALAELVAGEVLELLGCDSCAVWRYEDDRGIVMLGSRSRSGYHRFTRGTRVSVDDVVISSEVRRTGHAVRIADYGARDEGGPRRVGALGLRTVIGAPIMVGGEPWGTLTAAAADEERLPVGSEHQLELFAGLCAVAVVSAETTARLESHSAEQEALLGVARTALETPDTYAGAVMAAIAREAVRLLGLSSAAVIRYRGDGTADVLAEHHLDGQSDGEDHVAELVWRAKAEVSVGDPDPTADAGPNLALGHPVGWGVPIEIDGRIWGAIVVGGGHGLPVPADAAERLARFANLSALAVARLEARRALRARNAEVEELAAARRFLLVEALRAEERMRRRIGDALHDDALQELYAARQDLAEVGADDPALERARVAVEAAGHQLRDAVRDLHPAVSWSEDLETRLRAILDRGSERGGFQTRLTFDAAATGDLDDLVLALVRELVQNAVKHANAGVVSVAVRDDGPRVVVEVTDDGRGMSPERPGEALRAGHIGLASARERVEAIGGSFELASAEGEGTRVRITLPRGG